MSRVDQATSNTVTACIPSAFPDLPWGWYYGCQLRDLYRGPIKVQVGRGTYVVFRTEAGHVAALDARCVHMGADLSLGCVVGEQLRCPFHEWEFSGDGACVRIPASAEVPAFARQRSYPVAVRGPHVFLFNQPSSLFDMPFYDGRLPDDLLPAAPFDATVGLPWYMVAANGFDLQHFRAAHDRTLIGEPIVERIAPFARRITARFAVTGQGVRDRLTRRFSGPEVTMTVTSWGGTIVLVTAEFRRTTSYGMVCITPIGADRSHLRTIVWVPRRSGAIARALVDPLDAAVRRSFIRAFMRSDQERSEGIRYTPGTLIGADATLADYFTWLGETVRGEAQRLEKVGK